MSDVNLENVDPNSQMFIGGEFTDSISKRRIDSINPATGEVLTSYPLANADDYHIRSRPTHHI